MTELAKLLIEEGQPLRCLEGYLNQTFVDIKGKKVVDYLKEDSLFLTEIEIEKREISILEYIEILEDSIIRVKSYLLENEAQLDN